MPTALRTRGPANQLRKGQGQPCKPGERADLTHCIPIRPDLPSHKPPLTAPPPPPQKPTTPPPKKEEERSSVSETPKPRPASDFSDQLQEAFPQQAGEVSSFVEGSPAGMFGSLEEAAGAFREFVSSRPPVDRIADNLSHAIAAKVSEKLADKVSDKLGLGEGKGKFRKPRVLMPLGKLGAEKLKQFGDFFGRPLDKGHAGAIASAPDDALLNIKPAQFYTGPGFITSVKADGMEAERSFRKDYHGKIHVSNKNMEIEDDSPFKGEGPEILYNQVQALRELGVSEITTHAAGHFDDPVEYIGYYVWPRCGFSGEIDDDRFNDLPEDIQEKMGNSREVYDLFSLGEEGREAWKKYGGDIWKATFDLSDGSKNLDRLEKYIQERKEKRAKEGGENAGEPTSESGGGEGGPGGPGGTGPEGGPSDQPRGPGVGPTAGETGQAVGGAETHPRGGPQEGVRTHGGHGTGGGGGPVNVLLPTDLRNEARKKGIGFSVAKSSGQPCKPGERADLTHCIPTRPDQSAGGEASGAPPTDTTPSPEKEGKGYQKPRIKLTTNRPDLFEEFKDYLGIDIDEGDLGALACATDGAGVHLYQHADEYGRSKGMVTDVNDQGVRSIRIFKLDKDGLRVDNKLFKIDKDSPHKSKGYAIFHNQCKALQAIGVKTLHCDHAAGYKGGKYNGYYTWPVLGYEANMDDFAFKKLPPDLQKKMGDNRSVYDLFSLPGGADAWKEHGHDLWNCKFDLTPGSRSMKRLEAYKAMRDSQAQQKPKKPKGGLVDRLLAALGIGGRKKDLRGGLRRKTTPHLVGTCKPGQTAEQTGCMPAQPGSTGDLLNIGEGPSGRRPPLLHGDVPEHHSRNAAADLFASHGGGDVPDEYAARSLKVEGGRLYRRSPDGSWGEIAPPPEGGWSLRDGFGRVRRRRDGSYAGDESLALRAKGLHLPPLWRDVQIAFDPDSPLLATGQDFAGHLHVVYSPVDDTDAAKFERCKAFMAVLPALERSLREDAQQDTKEGDAAVVCLLMRKTGLRLGDNPKAAGATALTAGHVKLDGNTIHLHLKGKGGAGHRQEFDDPELAALLRTRIDKALRPQDSLFSCSPQDVKDYLRQVTDRPFLPRDFRTIVANEVAFDELQKVTKPPADEEAFQKIVKGVVATVAKKLGNTTAAVLESYICPQVFEPLARGEGWRPEAP